MHISVFKRTHLILAASNYRIPTQTLALIFKPVLPCGSHYTQLQYLDAYLHNFLFLKITVSQSMINSPEFPSEYMCNDRSGALVSGQHQEESLPWRNYDKLQLKPVIKKQPEFLLLKPTHKRIPFFFGGNNLLENSVIWFCQWCDSVNIYILQTDSTEKSFAYQNSSTLLLQIKLPDAGSIQTSGYYSFL